MGRSLNACQMSAPASTVLPRPTSSARRYRRSRSLETLRTTVSWWSWSSTDPRRSPVTPAAADRRVCHDAITLTLGSYTTGLSPPSAARSSYGSSILGAQRMSNWSLDRTPAFIVWQSHEILSTTVGVFQIQPAQFSSDVRRGSTPASECGYQQERLSTNLIPARCRDL